MSENTAIGGDTSHLWYTLIFLGGVLIGTGVRVAAWLLPAGLVSTVKARLR